MAAEDIPQTQNAFWGGLFSVLGPKLSMNAEDARKRKDMQADLYKQAILSGQLKPEQIDYSLSQIDKIYGGDSKQSKAMIAKLRQGVGQHIQSEAQQQGGQGQPQGQPQPDQSQPPRYGIPGGAGGAIPGGALPGAGGASPVAQSPLPPPVALQQPVGGGGQAPPSQTTGGGPLPPPTMNATGFNGGQMAVPTPTPQEVQQYHAQAAQNLQPPAGLTSGGVLASGFPNPYARADLVDVREHQHALDTYQKEADIRTQEAIGKLKAERKDKIEFALKPVDQGGLGLTPGSRDLKAFLGVPMPKPHNQKQVLVEIPGDEELHEVWADPQNVEGGVFDPKTGTHYEAGQYTPVNQGLATTEKRSKYWGPFGALYQAAKASTVTIDGVRRHPTEEEAKAVAAKEFQDKYGIGITKMEQDLALTSKVSNQPIPTYSPNIPAIIKGLPPKPGSAPPANGASPAGTAPASAGPPVTKNGINKAAPATGTATPMANRVLGAPSAANPLGLSQRDIDSANFLVGVQTGLQKGTGKAAQAQMIDGQKVLARVGVTPEEITARNEQRVTARKAIDKIAPIAEAVSALDNALSRHSTLLMNLRPQLPSTDVKKLNEWLQSGALEFNVKGISPAAIQYGIALQAVRNEYARIIEGSGASIAGTHVESMKKAGENMSGGFTTENTQAMLSMIDSEAKNKYGGYGDKLRELQQRMSEPLVPEITGGKYKPLVPDIPKPVSTVGGNVPTNPTRAEYDKLPKGANYVENGTTYTKR